MILRSKFQLDNKRWRFRIMKTILYNTTDKKLGRRFTPQYLVDGKAGQLPSNLIELTITN